VNIFRYIAKDSNGRDISATMEAENEKEVVLALRKKGLIILSVMEESRGDSVVRKTRRKVKGTELVVFSRQLATMVDAGLPLIQAIDTLAEQAESPALQAVLRDVVKSIEE